MSRHDDAAQAGAGAASSAGQWFTVESERKLSLSDTYRTTPPRVWICGGVALALGSSDDFVAQVRRGGEASLTQSTPVCVDGEAPSEQRLIECLRLGED